MKSPFKSSSLPFWMLTAALGIFLVMSNRSSALENQPMPQSRQLVGEVIQVPLYKSRVIDVNTAIQKISTGNEEIADLLVINSNQAYVLGKALGSTNILLWDRRGNLIQSLDVEVVHDLIALKKKMHEMLPNETVEVTTSQGAILLSGHVTSLDAMDTAIQIAETYTRQDRSIQEKEKDGSAEKKPGSGVVNLLSVGGTQQVMLKVTVAEMQRGITRRLNTGFNLTTNGGNNWTLGGINGGGNLANSTLFPNALNIRDAGLFSTFVTSNTAFSMTLDAAKETGNAKILAEPTLTTLSGQEASFLSGGEFPVPVSGDEDTVTVDYKEFGVGVKFLPTVLDSNRINLKLNVTVSEIENFNSFGIDVGNSTQLLIPGLSKRTATSSVELADGQTIAIAGLLNENIKDLVSKFPVLGDLPIIGSLFRSVEFEKGETELVILVTPQLTKPLLADQIALPTTKYIEPTDFEFYLMGKGIHAKEDKDEKSESKDQAAKPRTQTVPELPEPTLDVSSINKNDEANMVQSEQLSGSAFGHVFEDVSQEGI
ncbi:MAG: type II and III secretion system protein family protein [Pseudomonadota bacterium]